MKLTMPSKSKTERSDGDEKRLVDPLSKVMRQQPNLPPACPVVLLSLKLPSPKSSNVSCTYRHIYEGHRDSFAVKVIRELSVSFECQGVCRIKS